jgi:hypothetical protein
MGQKIGGFPYVAGPVPVDLSVVTHDVTLRLV